MAVVFSRGYIRTLSSPLQPTQFLITSTTRLKPPPHFFHTNSLLHSPSKPRTTTKPKYTTITVTKNSHKPPLPPKSALSKAKQNATSPLSSPPLPPSPSPSTTYTSYAAHLAAKGTPTLLYTAPSHTIYTIGSYSGALFCFAYAAYAYESVVLHGPADVPRWVNISFSVICLFSGAIGAYLLMGPSRVVKKILAVPARGARGAVAVRGGTPQLLRDRERAFAASGGGGVSSPLDIEIHLRSLIPRFLRPLTPSFVRPSTIMTVNPASLTLSHPLTPLLKSTRPRSLTAAERAAERAEREKRKLKWKTSVLTRPFQAMRQGAGEFWEGMRRVITREGFSQIAVKEKGTYKLDVRGGWTLVDGGRGSLDRLCKVRKA